MFSFQDLQDFCFRFAMNHMTAVTQTEAFANLDEAVMKNFIVRAAQSGAFKYWLYGSDEIRSYSVEDLLELLQKISLHE